MRWSSGRSLSSGSGEPFGESVMTHEAKRFIAEAMVELQQSGEMAQLLNEAERELQ